MYVKLINVKLTGIPTARVAVTTGETAMGAEQITMNISAEDSYGIPHQAASLRLSVAEARDLAERILKLVNK